MFSETSSNRPIHRNRRGSYCPPPSVPAWLETATLWFMVAVTGTGVGILLAAFATL